MIKSLYAKFLINSRNLVKNPVIINVVIVALITLIVKVISFFKETLIASTFGLSIILDTYFIAILIPSFVQNVFIGALKNLFIPNYISELKSTSQTNSFQTYTLIAISVLTTLLAILAIAFVEFGLKISFPGHDEQYYYLIRSQFYYVLPCLYLWGFSSFFSGLLEIKNKYFLSTISQIFLPITVILLMIFAKDLLGDYVLVIGLTAGSLLSLLFLFIYARYYKLIQVGRIIMNDNIRLMSRQYLPKVTSGILVGINPFVDQFFAAQLVVGSISAINYGTKIPAFVIGILLVAMGNVLLPYFSRAIIQDIRKAYLNLFKILKLIFLGSLVLTIAAIFFSEEIVRLLFERDNFTSDDTIVVSNIQKITLIYVPFYICTNVMVKFLTSINQNVFMAWISFFKLILNLVLNIILVKYFAVYGLVLATTIVLVTSSLLYISFTFHKYRNIVRS